MPVPSASALPEALTSLPHWVGWITETRAGSAKPTKVPYCLATGRRASSTSPADWIPFPDTEVPSQYEGIGFVFTKSAGFTGIDLDDCLTDTGALKPWAAAILADLPTYGEISPSGRGIKVWARALLPGTGLKAFLDPDGNRTVESMKDGAIEMYDSGRYFTVTGDTYGEPTEIADLQEEITKLYKRLRGNENPDSKAKAVVPRLPDSQIVTEGGRHHHLLTVAGRLRNEGLDPGTLLISLRAINQSQCSPPKPDHEIKGIVDYVAKFPPKYRLTKADYIASRPQVNGRPPLQSSALPAEAEAPPAETPPPPATDLLSYTENLLTSALSSKDPMQVLGVGTEPSALILALAQAGSIKQHEAKRRIKAVFKPGDVPLRELDARVRAAEVALTPVAEPGGFILTSEGGVRPILANAITALAPLDLAFDTFQQRVVLRVPSPWGTTGQWTDDDDLHGTEYLQRSGLLVENLRTTNGAARRNALKTQFHPVRDWLNSLEWDRQPRLDFWLNAYLGVPETALSLDFARMWMISAVARIFEPGCKADCMLVLESKQGVRKSSALRMLVNGHLDAGKEPFWFRDRIPTLSSDDVGLHMQGVWVIEIAELDAIRRSAAWTATKNFISDQSDTFRRKYGINLQDYPRQCVFAGSTNETEWLGDHTGGRRFWAVRVSDVDLEGIRRDRDQIWAEAIVRYRNGEQWYLSDEQEVSAQDEIESRMPQDVWLERVTAAANHLSLESTDEERSISIPQVLDYMKLETGRQGQTEQNRVARILRSLGYDKFRKRDYNGNRSYRYKRKDS